MYYIGQPISRVHLYALLYMDRPSSFLRTRNFHPSGSSHPPGSFATATSLYSHFKLLPYPPSLSPFLPLFSMFSLALEERSEAIHVAELFFLSGKFRWFVGFIRLWGFPVWSSLREGGVCLLTSILLVYSVMKNRTDVLGFVSSLID